ncbi:MAG: ATP-binding protein, partial [Candidatus Xenobia bacterium]
LTSFFGSGSLSMQQTPMDRFRLFEMATRQVRGMLEGGPALFVIEDLQWADAYSMEMLEYIVSSMTSDSTAGPTAVIVATIREEEEARNQAMVKLFKTLSSTAWMIDMPVNRLKESDVEEMVRSMLGASQAPRELSEVVYRETEGNPFFVGELLKALVAHGALAQDGDGWVLKDEEHNRILSPGGASAAGILPPTVQEAILQRLRKLPVMQREILQHAAVMGQVFSFDQVRASTGIDPIQMVDALEDLVTLRVLAEVPQANTPHYSFYHNKIREVLLTSMRAEQVQDIHLKVGVALETEQKKIPSAAGVFQLAFHFSRSGVWYRAKPYLVAAADHAMKGFAFTDAADYYRQILEAHSKDRILSVEEVYAVQEARAEALDASGAHVDAEVLFRQLVKQVPKGPDADLIRARLERKLARVHHAAGSYEEALKHFDQGLLALGIKVPKKGLATALHRLVNYWRVRIPALARRVPDVRRSQEILELCDGIIQTIYFMDPGGHLHHIWNAAFIYKQIATQGKDDADLATSEFLMAYLYAMHDRPKHVHKSLQKTLDVLQRMEDSPRKARLLRECGLLYYMLGWFNEALHYVTQGRELSSQIADVTGLAWASITESNVRWLQGDLEAATHLSQQAIQVATTTQMKSVWAISQSLLARQKMSAGDLEEPQRLLESMRRVAPGGSNRFEDLLSDLAYGMLRRREGRLSEAAALLQQAEKGFTAARSGNNYVLEAGVELAEVFVGLATTGRRDYAVAELDKLMRRLEPLARGIPIRRGAILRLQGQLAGARGQAKQAMALFQESQKVLESGGYYLDLAQTFEATGRWLESQGAGQGRTFLTRAAELYNNIGATRRGESLLA